MCTRPKISSARGRCRRNRGCWKSLAARAGRLGRKSAGSTSRPPRRKLPRWTAVRAARPRTTSAPPAARAAAPRCGSAKSRRRLGSTCPWISIAASARRLRRPRRPAPPARLPEPPSRHPPRLRCAPRPADWSVRRPGCRAPSRSRASRSASPTRTGSWASRRRRRGPRRRRPGRRPGLRCPRGRHPPPRLRPPRLSLGQERPRAAAALGVPPPRHARSPRPRLRRRGRLRGRPPAPRRHRPPSRREPRRSGRPPPSSRSIPTSRWMPSRSTAAARRPGVASRRGRWTACSSAWWPRR